MHEIEIDKERGTGEVGSMSRMYIEIQFPWTSKLYTASKKLSWKYIYEIYL